MEDSVAAAATAAADDDDAYAAEAYHLHSAPVHLASSSASSEDEEEGGVGLREHNAARDDHDNDHDNDHLGAWRGTCSSSSAGLYEPWPLPHRSHAPGFFGTLLPEEAAPPLVTLPLGSMRVVDGEGHLQSTGEHARQVLAWRDRRQWRQSSRASSLPPQVAAMPPPPPQPGAGVETGGGDAVHRRGRADAVSSGQEEPRFAEYHWTAAGPRKRTMNARGAPIGRPRPTSLAAAQLA
jgi:hypothetical protein